MEQTMNHEFLTNLLDCNSCYSRDSSLQKNSKNYVKQTFQFITVCKGDMNHHKPKTAKITLGLNLGLYHHVLNSCCLYKASHSEYI